MFRHLFVYRLKCMWRDRTLVFWTLLFPLILGTLFYAAFGRLVNMGGAFSPIRTAVVDSPAYRADAALQHVLGALSQPGDRQLLDLTVCDRERAEGMLRKGDIGGIIIAGSPPKLVVRESGLGQSVLRIILDEYIQTSATAARILQQNPQAGAELSTVLQEHVGYTTEISFSDAPPNTLLIYFYALIAMTCLMGSYWGLKNTLHTQASFSGQALRRSVAPTHKLAMVATDAAAALVLAALEVLLLVAYLALVLRIGFGASVGYILLTCLLGSMAGVAWGTLLGTVFRLSEGTKVGILTGCNLFLSFLAGLMFVNVKDFVATRLPALSYINPAALITDALYSLYIFDNHNRYFLNMGLLCVIILTFCAAGFLKLRRERYVSL